MRKCLIAISAALLLSGCGSAALPNQNPGGTPSSPGETPGGLVVKDQDNGRTVSVRTGERVTVELASTYWMIAGSSNPAVLRPAGQPQVRPSGSCVPGGGCGVASQAFDAAAPGTAVISASRNSCGEAMACSPAESMYRVTVQVTG